MKSNYYIKSFRRIRGFDTTGENHYIEEIYYVYDKELHKLIPTSRRVLPSYVFDFEDLLRKSTKPIIKSYSYKYEEAKPCYYL